MADALLKLGLWGLGISAILIGGCMAFFESHAVANFFVEILRIVSDDSPITGFLKGNL